MSSIPQTKTAVALARDGSGFNDLIVYLHKYTVNYTALPEGGVSVGYMAICTNSSCQLATFVYYAVKNARVILLDGINQRTPGIFLVHCCLGFRAAAKLIEALMLHCRA